MKRTSIIWLVLIQWALAFEWLHSGWSKWSGPGFITNIGKTLQGFATKTPYTSYGSFLQNSVIPHSELFGNIIRSGEILVGIALVLGGLLLLYRKNTHPFTIWLLVTALFAGALMNLNFFLASGWSSPSAWGVNIIMGFTHLILGLHYVLNRRELASE